jgi:predicted ATPase/DNA-binding SARP family transcriptional activator
MQFRILGPLQVLAEGRPIEAGAPKQRALLAFLLIHANRVVSADRILEEVWAGDPPPGDRKTLQVHISKLRKALAAGADSGTAPLRTEGAGYLLEVGPDDLDATRFERLWRRARADLEVNPGHAAAELRRALGLWRGPALADFAYETFAQSEIRRLEDLRLGALEDAMDAALALGREAEILPHLEALCDEHPLRERLRGQLMVALFRLGRQAEALRACSNLRRLLTEELGIELSPQLHDLEDRILLHDAGLLHAPRPSATAHELPLRLTTFVGRWKEQAALQDMLAEHRLVTVTGVGGVGKTSLAIEAAREARVDHPDGTWLVALAALTDPGLVAAQVTGGLGLSPLGGTDAAGALTAYLVDRRALLVLDNCEHLAEAVARLADRLLRRCPELRILATSRLPLRLEGEAVFSLPPLPVPADEADPGQVAASPAVQLLVQRAALRQPGFALDETNAGPLSTICRRAAGIPLAIELAAARLPSLSVEELAQGMDEQLELLTVGSQTADPRQHTLDAALGWSYRLLAENEQRALRRASVFHGGFDLAAAEAVISDEPTTRGRVADLLSRLVEASLLNVRVEDGAATYSLLEPVRQYGVRRLQEAGEAQQTHRRHAEHFAARVASLPGFEESGRWTELMRVGKLIIDDCRAAIAWGVAGGAGETSLRLAASLTPYWRSVTALREGFGALSAALRVTPREPTPQRLRALFDCASFAVGANESADEWLDELQEWATALGTRAAYAQAVGARGLVAFVRGNLEEAVPLLWEAYRSAAVAGPPAVLLGVDLAECLTRVGRLDEADELLDELHRLVSQSRAEAHDDLFITITRGMVAFARGDLARAEPMLEEGVREFGRQASLNGQMESMLYLAWIALDLGKDRRARMLADRCLATARRQARSLHEATSLWILARLALHRGELAEARARLQECTDVARRRRESFVLAMALFVWADLTHAAGNPERSARLFGAAGGALAAIPHIMPPTIGIRYDRIMDELRQSLGEGILNSLLSEGERLTPDEAVTLATAQDDPAAASAGQRQG